MMRVSRRYHLRAAQRTISIAKKGSLEAKEGSFLLLISVSFLAPNLHSQERTEMVGLD